MHAQRRRDRRQPRKSSTVACEEGRPRMQHATTPLRAKVGKRIKSLAAAARASWWGGWRLRGRPKVGERVECRLSARVGALAALACLHEGEATIRRSIAAAAARRLYVPKVGEVSACRVARVSRLVERGPFGVITAGGVEEENRAQEAREHACERKWPRDVVALRVPAHLSALPAGPAAVATTSLSKDWPSSSDECSDADEWSESSCASGKEGGEKSGVSDNTWRSRARGQGRQASGQAGSRQAGTGSATHVGEV